MIDGPERNVDITASSGLCSTNHSMTSSDDYSVPSIGRTREKHVVNRQAVVTRGARPKESRCLLVIVIKSPFELHIRNECSKRRKGLLSS